VLLRSEARPVCCAFCQTSLAVIGLPVFSITRLASSINEIFSATAMLMMASFTMQSFLESVGLNEVGFLQRFLLIGIHDQGSLVSRLKRAAALQQQAGGAAVLASFDFYRCGHGRSLLKADVRPKID